MVGLSSHVVRAGIAAGWNYSGRVVGLGWTALLIAKLGFTSYGQYAMAVAIAAIVNAAVDNAFFVRSLRVDDSSFLRERCTRVILGLTLGVVGVAVFPFAFIVGLAVIIAAAELLFNTFKSRYMRAGRPDLVTRFDTMRQVSSIGIAAVYLVVAHSPSLVIASALYVFPYLVVAALCVPYIAGQRPKSPGGPREIAMLSTEALAAAAYSQAPLLVVGAVAGHTAAGYYSLAQVSALAIAMLGQHYANTYIEKMRAAAGHRESAPSLTNVVRMAAGTGVAMIILGVGLLIWGGADDAGYTCLILSAFVSARSINFVFTTILFLQHRDSLRVRATVAVAVLQLALLFPMTHLLGVYGAAISCVACETVLLVTYYRVVYRSVPHTTNSVTQPGPGEAAGTAQSRKAKQQ